MKKLGFIVLFIGLVLFMSGCKTEDEPPINGGGGDPMRVLVGIDCVDSAKQTITSMSTYVGIDYAYSGVTVLATYDDSSTMDVTSLASFSEVNTAVAGTYTVTATYAGKTASYQLVVSSAITTRLDLNTTRTKLLFKKGDVFNYQGLVVKAIKENNTSITITNYSISVYDEDNYSHALATPFTETGTYKAVVRFEGVTAFYQFVVYDSEYDLTTTFDIDSLGSSFVDQNGQYTYPNTQRRIYDSTNATVTALGNGLVYQTRDANGDIIEQEYIDDSFSARLVLGATENQLQIVLSNDCEVFLVAGGIEGRTILFTQGETTITPIGNINSEASLLHCKLEAGTYNLSSSYGQTYLYSMTFNYDDVEEVTLESIDLTTTTVKTTYQIGESIDYTNLVIKANFSDGSTENVAQSDCTFTLKKGTVTKTTLDEAGTYTVTVTYEGKTANYTITVAEATLESIDLTTTTVKTTYQIGETLDYTNLVIKANFSDGSIQNVAQADCTFTLKKGTVTKTSLDEAGTYTVTVTYNGKTANYTITVEAAQDVTFASIRVDTSGATKSFNEGETFSSEGILVYGVISAGNEILLPQTDYSIQLTLYSAASMEYQAVDALSVSGNYRVEITYTGDYECTNPSTNYVVKYTSSKIMVTFGYSGLSSSDEARYPFFDRELDYSRPIDPRDYIEVPDGYAFLGFSNDLNDPSNPRFVKIYVRKCIPNKYVVAYLSPEYRYTGIFQAYSLNETIVVPNAPNSAVIPNFVRWGVAPGQTVTGNTYILAVCVSTELEETPNILFASSTEVTISIPNSSNLTNLQFSVALYVGNELIENITSLRQVLSDLAVGTTYTVRGSYTGELDGVTVNVTLEELNFTTSIYTSFDNLVPESTLANVSANAFAVQVAPYLDAAPEGYRLAGFLVSDASGQLIEDFIYDGSVDTLYVTDLANNTEYLVQPYYDRVQQQRNRALDLDYSGLPGYRIHFVGFWILTKGDVMYRVRMQYHGETLYTWYVAENSGIAKPCSFLLPIKYDNYKMIGTLDDLSKITADTDSEVVLVPPVETGTYTVVFYDYFDEVLDIQFIDHGEAAITPTPIQSFTYGNYRYDFEGWTKDFDSVVSTTYTKAKYKASLTVAPYFSEQYIVVGTDFVYSYHYQRNFEIDARNSFKEYLVDDLGNKIDLDFTNHQGIIRDLAPKTDYKHYIYYEYELDDGNGKQIVEIVTQFTTLDPTKLCPSTMTISDITYRAAKVSVNNPYPTSLLNPTDIFIMPEDANAYYGTLANLNKVSEAYFNHLKVNYGYTAYMAKQSDSNSMLFYAYPNSQVFYTLPAEQPEFEHYANINFHLIAEYAWITFPIKNPDNVEFYLVFDIYVEENHQPVYMDVDYSKPANDGSLCTYPLVFAGDLLELSNYVLTGTVYAKYFYDGGEYSVVLDAHVSFLT